MLIATILHRPARQNACPAVTPGSIEFRPMSDVVRLEYRNVTMRFVEQSGKSLTAVQQVSLCVHDGEVVAWDCKTRITQIS
jgi:ABC-type glutathione transport system ATPase component